MHINRHRTPLIKKAQTIDREGSQKKDSEPEDQSESDEKKKDTDDSGSTNLDKDPPPYTYQPPSGLDISHRSVSELGQVFAGAVSLDALKDYFPHFHEAIYHGLLSHHVFTESGQIWFYPSLPMLVSWITKALPIIDLPEFSGIKDPHKRVSSYKRYIQNISFEILGYLISGLPKLHAIGTLNTVSIQIALPKLYRRLISLLKKHRIINEKNEILFVPPYHEFSRLFEPVSDSPSSYIHTVWELLIGGVGQFGNDTISPSDVTITPK